MTPMLMSVLLATSGPAVHGAALGTAQDMTFAIILGTFMALAILMLFWLRSGHERARRKAVAAEQRLREQTRERARVLEAHELTPRAGEGAPR